MVDGQELRKRLEARIAELPPGYISKKTIKGKTQYYLQWNDGEKLRSKYIRAEDVETVRGQIEERKKLQEKLKELQLRYPDEAETVVYETNLIFGDSLRIMTDAVAEYRTRDCYGLLKKFLAGTDRTRVCALYGLRRTGKTTLLLQAIAGMPDAEFRKCVSGKLRTENTMDQVTRDLQKLFRAGYRYVFLDEVTLMKDFVDSAALFSDIYAMQGMKIVLSGTDSLGFWFAEHEELYDRAYTIHTTFIPFREHARLLGIHDIDEYICYGGTLRAGEMDFDDPDLNVEDASFRDDESTRRYIDTAICNNIQHSLACCEDGGHFRHLLDLYEAGELTNAINRIIENMNKYFLVSVIERKFSSSDLGNTRNNLLKEQDPEKQSDALENIDEHEVLGRMKAILGIKEKEELSVKITPAHMTEIKEYLRALDLIVDCPMRTASASEPVEQILFTQPGMRYCQAQALVHALMKDPSFADLSEREIKLVTERLLNDVKGRMMEDIILLECAKVAGKHQKVFKLKFDRGEFDMVIYDSDLDSCAIYEIKHSDKVVENQYRHLLNEDLCNQTERRFGEITAKTVLYRGESHNDVPDVEYRNAADFLKALPESMDIDQGQGFTMDLG